MYDDGFIILKAFVDLKKIFVDSVNTFPASYAPLHLRAQREIHIDISWPRSPRSHSKPPARSLGTPQSAIIGTTPSLTVVNSQGK